MEHNFKYEDMAKLISVYFKGLENKNVKVSFGDGEGEFISLTEISRVNGLTQRNPSTMEKDYFEKVVRDIYDCAGRVVTDIVNYGKEGSTVIEHGFTKVVTPELANHVVVTTKEKQKVLTR